MLGVKVVSQPVLLFRLPLRSNVACQIAPRAVIGNEQFISVLVEGEAIGHPRRRLLSIGGITRRWRHGYRTLRQQPDITPYTADSIRRD